MMIFFLNHRPTNSIDSSVHHQNQRITNEIRIHLVRFVMLHLRFSLFSYFIDDAVSSLSRSLKSGSFSIQENGDGERSTSIRRRMSVLDEKALREDDTKLVREQRINAISRSYQVILESVGEDPSRQGLFLMILFC